MILDEIFLLSLETVAGVGAIILKPSSGSSNWEDVGENSIGILVLNESGSGAMLDFFEAVGPGRLLKKLRDCAFLLVVRRFFSSIWLFTFESQSESFLRPFHLSYT